jgi:hypothetical protein
MELTIKPKIYKPIITPEGNYCDTIPTVSDFEECNGVSCMCGSKSIFLSPVSFKAHIKTQKHIKWINHLNANKLNYFVENEALREENQNQKIIIARLERTIQSYGQSIINLTEQNRQQNQQMVNVMSNISLIDL